jgi:hypothetical protein
MFTYIYVLGKAQKIHKTKAITLTQKNKIQEPMYTTTESHHITKEEKGTKDLQNNYKNSQIVNCKSKYTSIINNLKFK